MKKPFMLPAIVGFLTGSLITVLIASNAVTTKNIGMMRMMGMSQGANSPMASTIDQHFIGQMVPHHDGAIEMAKLALERSRRDEVKTLARSIIESQTAEITAMQDWYQRWFGADVPVDANATMGMGRGVMHGGMMGGDTADLDTLRNAPDFDRAFVTEMIPHHQMAIVMAQMLKPGSSRPEMQQLARDIIDAQQAEIDLMRSWLRAWE